MPGSGPILVDLSVAPLGGAGTYAEGFARALAASEPGTYDDLVVLLDRRWAEERPALVEDLRAAGIGVDELDLPPPGTWPARLGRGRTTRAAVERHRAAVSYFPRDVVPRGVGPYVLLANNMFAWRDHEAAGAVGGRGVAALVRRNARRSAIGADRVLAVSRPMADAVRPTAPVQAIVHHGIDLPEGTPERADADAPQRAMVIGTVNEHKRFDVAIRGVAEARRSGTPFTLDVWGGNHESAVATDLDDLALALLGERVVRGPVTGEGLAESYRRADVLVLATTFESFCFPLVEAMRSGCVVVAPASALVDEICGDVAITYPEGDSVALGNALDLAWAEREHRSAAGVERARPYRWSTTVATTVGHLRAVRDGS